MSARPIVTLTLTRAECLVLSLCLEERLHECRKQLHVAQRRNQQASVQRTQQHIAVTDALLRRITDAEKAS